MKVRSNAETPNDARMARRFGAEGIGLCRTEHMFFDGGRIVAMREMIVAETIEGRRAALAKILPMQRDDFVELFRIMKGLPVTVRLLDPPLHEFLPNTRSEMEEVAKAAGVSVDHVAQRAAMLKESNPMLGHRGCRLGITYPEVYEMQARAIFEAAALVKEETGETVEAEIMIPLVAIPREFTILKEMVDRVEAEVTATHGIALSYTVGTMIELPRACLLADKIALDAAFFSFGTNDLTQTTYGLSRDDAARFLQEYERRGILAIDPFISLDPDGVGELVKIAAERGRRTRPELKLGICGEHGGDPASIRFCASVGFDYSVTPASFYPPRRPAALSETGAAAHATDFEVSP
jgi:pyruvate,orthophosphate dikinase